METAGSMLQMVLSFAVVVAMILGLAWLTRRMQGLRAQHGGPLRVCATIAVGAKERVVIVEAAGQQFLIGVAPGQVSILKALGPGSPVLQRQSRDRSAPCTAAAEGDPGLAVANPGYAVAEPGCIANPGYNRPPGLRDSFAHQLKQLLAR